MLEKIKRGAATRVRTATVARIGIRPLEAMDTAMINVGAASRCTRLGGWGGDKAARQRGTNDDDGNDGDGDKDDDTLRTTCTHGHTDSLCFSKQTNDFSAGSRAWCVGCGGGAGKMVPCDMTAAAHSQLRHALDGCCCCMDGE